MPFNGSGGFVPIAAPNYPAVAGQPVYASQFNANMTDLFSGFGNCVTRDGQSPWTQNLPAGGFKLTNLAAGTTNGDSLAYGQATVVLTGPLRLAAGAVGAPAYSFNGDTDNGWWSPAADTQAWSLAGAEAMRLSSVGLGLGIAPVVFGGAAKTFHIHDSGTLAELRLTNATTGSGAGQGGIVQAQGNDLYLWNGENSFLSFGTNNLERMRITAIGDVGIGTVPAAGIRLHVSSAGSLGRFQTTNARGGGNGYLEFNDPTGNKGYIGYGSGSNDGFNIINALNEFMTFGTNNLTRMRINADGTVGIGVTPSTGALLEVEGAIQVRSTNRLQFTNTLNSVYIHAPASNVLSFGTNSAERMRIDSAGNVGIGLAPSHILDISLPGVNLRQRIAAGAGFMATLSLCGNNATTGTTSLDLQQDSASNVDLVQRASARMSFYTNNSERLRINADGSLYGTALHNNGTPTGTTTQYIASGTYSPTPVGVTNIDSVSLVGTAKWLRLGNCVLVFVRCSVDPTSLSTSTEYRIPLPIASNLQNANLTDLMGGGTGSATPQVIADNTNDQALVQFTSSSVSAAATGQSLWFMYEVLA